MPHDAILALPYVLDLGRRHYEEIGFIPRPRLEQYARDGQLWTEHENGDLCGYLVWGNGWPVLRVYQVCIQYDAQRRLHGARVPGRQSLPPVPRLPEAAAELPEEAEAPRCPFTRQRNGEAMNDPEREAFLRWWDGQANWTGSPCAVAYQGWIARAETARAENAALREAGRIVTMELLQSGAWDRIDDEARAAADAFLPKSLKAVSSQGKEPFGSEPFTPCGDCPTPLSCGNSGCAVQLVERAMSTPPPEVHMEGGG